MRYLAAVVVVLLLAGPSRAADPAGQEPLFVFAVIGDSHITVTSCSDSKYGKAVDKSAELLAAYVKDINAHVPRVSFALHLGDITDKGVWSEFKIARGILDSLDCALYPVVGNHDNFESDNKASWKRFAGMDSTSYAFDFLGFRFIVIDCTQDPYTPGAVNCRKALREWVAKDLERNRDKHAFVVSHYNMWERFWNSEFDTTRHYEEYKGMRELRSVLEDAGNVVAVINGHVHANRIEEHGGIRYIDVGATLVGRPSVRYFSVFPDRVEITYSYISDKALLDYVVKVSRSCVTCFSKEAMADFADGGTGDKQATILLRDLGTVPER
ncbi:MAG: metallophosphoesterase [bacterium]